MMYPSNEPLDRNEQGSRRSEAALRRALDAISQTDRLLDASSQILQRPTLCAEGAPDEIRYRVVKECGLHDRNGARLRDGDVVCQDRIAETDRIREMVRLGHLVQDDYRLPVLPNSLDRSGDGTWLA